MGTKRFPLLSKVVNISFVKLSRLAPSEVVIYQPFDTTNITLLFGTATEITEKEVKTSANI